MVTCLSESEPDCWHRSIEALSQIAHLDERTISPLRRPCLRAVHQWTVERDAQDVRRLLEWLPEARSSRERRALLERVRSLLAELERALDGLDEMA